MATWQAVSLALFLACGGGERAINFMEPQLRQLMSDLVFAEVEAGISFSVWLICGRAGNSLNRTSSRFTCTHCSIVCLLVCPLARVQLRANSPNLTESRLEICRNGHSIGLSC